MSSAAPTLARDPLSGSRPRALAARFGVTAGLTALALAVFGCESLASVLQLDVGRLSDLWRIVTCHFVHWDHEHLFWDVLMFASLAGLLEARGRSRLVCCVALSAIAISMAVAFGANGIAVYRGLSGIDSALFVLAIGVLLKDAWSEACRCRVWLLGLAAIGFVGKVVFELTTGSALFADSQAFVPVPLAHVVGAAVGGIVAIGWPARRDLNVR